MTRLYTLFCLCFCLVVMACGDDDGNPVPFGVNFSSTELGVSGVGTEVEATILFSRPATSDGNLSLSIAGSLSYGESNQFYTIPSAENNTLTLSFQQGDESVSFKVVGGQALNIQQDETVSLRLEESSGAIFQLGTNVQLDVLFSENFVSPGAIIELNAGGDSFPLQAFVDLSKSSQTTVDKHSWDLGFYTGDDHYVIINNVAAAMARKLDAKNDLTQVSASDTLNFAAEMVTNGSNFNVQASWVDTPDGDLTTTALGAIQALEEDNKVFILKRTGPNESWKKIRILQSGANYTIQHADIDDQQFASVEVAKNDTHNFVFLDLDDGVVQVEPEKGLWDIQYGKYTNLFGGVIPYSFSDYIITNRYNTTVAMVMIEGEVTFDSFTLAQAKQLDFKTEINAIGSSWRQGGSQSTPPQLFEDRFYVINDSEGNYYKLKFTRLFKLDVERGRPEFIYELLQ